jgi:hypothetical protein
VGRKLERRILNGATSFSKYSKWGFFSGAMARILNHEARALTSRLFQADIVEVEATCRSP